MHSCKMAVIISQASSSKFNLHQLPVCRRKSSLFWSSSKILIRNYLFQEYLKLLSVNQEPYYICDQKLTLILLTIVLGKFFMKYMLHILKTSNDWIRVTSWSGIEETQYHTRNTFKTLKILFIYWQVTCF